MAKRAKASAKKRVKPIPAGYRSVTPYLTVRDGARAIDFYKDALGAVEKVRMIGPDGRSVMHAELKIGDSIVMLSDEFPGMSTCRSPQSLGGTTVSLFLYVRDVDAAFKRASNSGCKVLMEPTDMFWGDRFGKLEDPFGNQWSMATHTENVSPKELGRRAQAAMAQRPGTSS
ncbi:MAG: glyoxalase [Candidatus Rokuibacteriota bacterium]|nr:MAG: glyoxalase [Candidatus Rokubacteria bacterium]